MHLWSISTVASATCLSRLADTLSPDEVERGRRFRFENLTDRFVIARGALRMLIGRYLGIEAGEVQFVYNSSGKPGLASDAVKFNLSHSGELALFAITNGCEIGIDVEQIRGLHDMKQIAKRIFSLAEMKELEQVDEDQRLHSFFLGWTRKEAYIKAIGLGLSVGMDKFQVTLDPHLPACLLQFPDTLPSCTLHDLKVAPGYAAAVAYQDMARELTHYLLRDPADLVELVT